MVNVLQDIGRVPIKLFCVKSAYWRVIMLLHTAGSVPVRALAPTLMLEIDCVFAVSRYTRGILLHTEGRGPVRVLPAMCR